MVASKIGHSYVSLVWFIVATQLTHTWSDRSETSAARWKSLSCREEQISATSRSAQWKDRPISEEQSGVVQLVYPRSVRECHATQLHRTQNASIILSGQRKLESNGTAGNSDVSHWALHGHGGHPEGAGSSWYTRVFDLLDTGFAVQGFQVGLGGAWLQPDAKFDVNKCPCGSGGFTGWCTDGTCFDRGGCADVWETMEGGLGYWRNELPSKHVKWRINNVNGCFATEMMSTHWDFLGNPIACADRGLVVVSNQIVMPPDGLSFEDPPDFGMLGQAFMRTTLGRTGPAKDAKGAFTYLLVLDAANFAGPVAYTLEEFWRDNKGYPEAPDFSQTNVKIGATGFEFNGMEAYTSSEGDINLLKIPKLKFPISPEQTTVIMTGVRGWAESTLQEPLEAALEGGVIPQTMMALSKGIQEDCNIGYMEPLKIGFAGFPLIQLGGNMQFNRRDATGECVSEIVWNEAEAACEGGLPLAGGSCYVPEFWQEQVKRMHPVTPSMLPLWSTLQSRQFPEKTYDSVPSLDARLDGSAHGSCDSNPGPSSDILFCIRTIGGSIVGYKWYRFVDQPTLQRSGLTESERDYLQQRVERLHELLLPHAPINHWMEAPPEAPKLAKLDTGLLVTPPAGFEKGHVPVVLYEGDSDHGCTFAGEPLPPPMPRPTPAPTKSKLGPGMHWIIGAMGESCSDACDSRGATCLPSELDSVDTPKETALVAQMAGITCTSFKGWAYDASPSQCMESSCCGDGSCKGACTYGKTSSRTCEAQLSEHSRFCPCQSSAKEASSSPTPGPTTRPDPVSMPAISPSLAPTLVTSPTSAPMPTMNPTLAATPVMSPTPAPALALIPTISLTMAPTPTSTTTPVVAWQFVSQASQTLRSVSLVTSRVFRALVCCAIVVLLQIAR